MKKVLVIDSGSGGLNILASCINSGVGGNFLYYSDQKNLPYGNKTKRELQKILSNILEEVASFFRFDVVLLACNTLTTSVIDYARRKYSNILFVGTVPATKPAFEKYRKDEVLVMATQRTLENLNEKGLCVSHLPELIDDNLFSLEKLKPYLTENLSKHIRKKGVVLGCTHYLAVKNIVKDILPQTEIFDSAGGVSKRMKIVCGDGDYAVQFMSSRGDNGMLSSYFRSLLKKS